MFLIFSFSSISYNRCFFLSAIFLAAAGLSIVSCIAWWNYSNSASLSILSNFADFILMDIMNSSLAYGSSLISLNSFMKIPLLLHMLCMNSSLYDWLNCLNSYPKTADFITIDLINSSCCSCISTTFGVILSIFGSTYYGADSNSFYIYNNLSWSSFCYFSKFKSCFCS